MPETELTVGDSLKVCEICGGFVGECPENYEGRGIPHCFCNRERHVEETVFRSGGSADLHVQTGDATQVASKGPGE